VAILFGLEALRAHKSAIPPLAHIKLPLAPMVIKPVPSDFSLFLVDAGKILFS
jgi:hypothetical protein